MKYILAHVRSKFVLVTIQLTRLVDHTYRYIFGFPIQKYSEITPQLYVGGQYGAHSTKRLNELGITGIVNMRTSPAPDFMRGKGFTILHLPTDNYQEPSMDNLAKGVVFINQQLKSGGKVYIHCQFGEGRGPSMAIAYLISTGLLLEDAFAAVRKIRPFISLTKVQQDQLKKFAAKYTPTKPN